MANNEKAGLDDWANEQLHLLRPANEWKPATVRAWRLFEERKRSKRPQLAWRYAVLTAIAVLFSFTFPQPRALAQRCVDACQIFLARRVAAVAQRPTAPEFEFTGANGTTARLSNYHGKVVLLNFWATWCGGCKLEMPWFAAFHQIYAKDGLSVIGIALDEEGWTNVEQYLKSKPVPYEIGIASGEIGNKFGTVAVLPLTLIIDRQGRIASRHVGVVDRNAMERELQALLHE